MKNGFTLAEVLITLGIIGVVAAMTLPTLSMKTQNAECRAALKVAYSLLTNAATRMKADDVSVNPRDYPSNTFVLTFRNYFKLAHKGGTYWDCTNNDIFITTEESENNPGTTDTAYFTYNRSRNIYTKLLDDGQFILANGMLVAFENNPTSFEGNGSIYIHVDVNGKSKKPNVWGIDLFTFQFMNNGQILPMGAPGTDYEDNPIACSKDSDSIINGIGCAQPAIADDNYWKNL